MSTTVILDASNAFLGRLCSYAAKQALLGKQVIVVNCEAAVISGTPRSIIAGYKQKRARGGTAQRGPYFPRSPERIVKRTIRGMVPHHQERGLTAIRRVRCYNDVPVEYKDKPLMKMGEDKPIETMTLKALAKELS